MISVSPSRDGTIEEIHPPLANKPQQQSDPDPAQLTSIVPNHANNAVHDFAFDEPHGVSVVGGCGTKL